ncbi:MAG: methyltransferase domain-containing protein [Oscillospiraceae bacterium]|nr:methyltransferase domain-containing protein [Oscillospiraceae bacterium]
MLAKHGEYDQELTDSAMMGPNALLLAVELTQSMSLREGMMVLDLGCGKALSSVFLAREFGVVVFAVDSQVHASENYLMIKENGLQDKVFPINGEASALPFNEHTFDALICINAFHNFGTGESFFSEKLVPLLKPGAQFGLAIPCLAKEFYDQQPSDQKEFFDSCAMPAFITAEKWRRLVGGSAQVRIDCCREMDCTHAAWNDWIRVNSPHSLPGDGVQTQIDPTLPGDGVQTQIDPKIAFVMITGKIEGK